MRAKKASEATRLEQIPSVGKPAVGQLHNR